jgi:hypothetical protein
MNRIEKLKQRNNIKPNINETHATLYFQKNIVKINKNCIYDHKCSNGRLFLSFISDDEEGIKCARCNEYLCKFNSPDVIIETPDKLMWISQET